MKARKRLGNVFTCLGGIALFIGLIAYLLPRSQNHQLKLITESFRTPTNNWLLKVMNSGMSAAMDNYTAVLVAGLVLVVLGILLICSVRSTAPVQAQQPRPAYVPSPAAQPNPFARAQAPRTGESNPFARYIAADAIPKSTAARSAASAGELPLEAADRPNFFEHVFESEPEELPDVLPEAENAPDENGYYPLQLDDDDYDDDDDEEAVAEENFFGFAEDDDDDIDDDDIDDEDVTGNEDDIEDEIDDDNFAETITETITETSDDLVSQAFEEELPVPAEEEPIAEEETFIPAEEEPIAEEEEAFIPAEEEPIAEEEETFVPAEEEPIAEEEAFVPAEEEPIAEEEAFVPAEEEPIAEEEAFIPAEEEPVIEEETAPAESEQPAAEAVAQEPVQPVQETPQVNPLYAAVTSPGLRPAIRSTFKKSTIRQNDGALNGATAAGENRLQSAPRIKSTIGHKH